MGIVSFNNIVQKIPMAANGLAISGATTKLLQFRKSGKDSDCNFVLFATVTPVLIILLAIFVTPKQFILGSPITCYFAPNQGVYGSFIDAKCLTGGTLSIEHSKDSNPDDYAPVNKWYPFSPLIIFLLAFPFIITAYLWNSLNSQTGINVDKICENAKTFQNIYNSSTNEQRDKYLQHLMRNLKFLVDKESKHPYITSSERCCRPQCNCFRRSNQSYLANLWITVKIMFLLSIILDIFLLAKIMGPHMYFLGFNYISRFDSTKSIVMTETFPFVTWCKVLLYDDSKVTPETQCLMNLNFFNEKIFVLIWFWFLILFIYGLFDLLSSIFFINSRYVTHYVFKSYLPPITTSSMKYSQMKFLSEGLSRDAVVALGLMTRHIDHSTMSNLISRFCETYSRDNFVSQMNAGVELHDAKSLVSDDIEPMLENFANNDM